MLDRIGDIISGSGDLVRAEAEILGTRIVRSSLGLICIFAGIAAALTGLAGLLVAATALIADQAGWVAALAIASAAILLFAGTAITTAFLAMRAGNRRSNMPASTKALSEKAEQKLEPPAADESDTKPQKHSQISEPKPGPDGIKQQLAGFIAHNPGIAAGGTLAAIALLGPGRTIKFAGRAIMLAQLANSVKKQAETTQSDASSPGQSQ